MASFMASDLEFSGLNLDPESFESDISECDAIKDLESNVETDDECMLVFEVPTSCSKAKTCEDLGIRNVVDGSRCGADVAVSVENIPKRKLKRLRNEAAKASSQDKGHGGRKRVYDSISEMDITATAKKILQTISEDASLAILPNSPGWQLRELAIALKDITWEDHAPLQACVQNLWLAMLNSTLHLNPGRLSVAGELAMLQDITDVSFKFSAEWVAALQTLDLKFGDNIYNLFFQKFVDLFFSVTMQTLDKH